MPTARKIAPKLAKPAAKVAPKAAAPVEAKAPPKVVVKAKAEPKERVSTFAKHEVTAAYQGPSTGLNKRKSLAVIPHNEFGTKPDYVLTTRSEQVAKALKDKYAKTPFQRMNLDAGILKFLVWRGKVKPISGDGRSPNDTYQFVD